LKPALHFGSKFKRPQALLVCPATHVHNCRFVEQEVERVKVLFEQKEGRLRSERDAAQRQLQKLQAQQDEWEAQVCSLPSLQQV
jgi:cell division protein FtsB